METREKDDLLKEMDFGIKQMLLQYELVNSWIFWVFGWMVFPEFISERISTWLSNKVNRKVKMMNRWGNPKLLRTLKQIKEQA